MTAALLSSFGTWWARLFSRAQALPYAAPPQELTASPEPEAAAAVDVASVDLKPASAAPARPPPNAARRPQTLAALSNLRQIPALQSLVNGLSRTACREGVSVDEIVSSLQKDSSLCVRLLTMSNSVAVASVEHVEDLHTAVQLLGVARVRRAAQAAFTLRDEQRMAEGVDWRHLWIHALATASIGEELERRIRPSDSSQVYLPALLHDVGKIVLSTVSPELYRTVMNAAWNGGGSLEPIEEAVLGVNHGEAGGVFARHTSLAPAVVQAAEHHDQPAMAESHRFEVAVVSLANYLCKEHGFGFSGSRLGPEDGDLEDHPSWRVIEEETGFAQDPEAISRGMEGFFLTLREDVRSMHGVSGRR